MGLVRRVGRPWHREGQRWDKRPGCLRGAAKCAASGGKGLPVPAPATVARNAGSAWESNQSRATEALWRQPRLQEEAPPTAGMAHPPQGHAHRDSATPFPRRPRPPQGILHCDPLVGVEEPGLGLWGGSGGLGAGFRPFAPYSKYSAAGVVAKAWLALPGAWLALPGRASAQLGLFQLLLQCVQGSSAVKEEKR